MTMVKPSFENFIKTCTPLLKIPDLEQQMRERVRNIVRDLLDFESSSEPAQHLKEFLKTDPNFLGVLLALTNLSQEKFLRIITAKRFTEGDFGPEWNADRIYAKIKNDDLFAEQITRLFLEGRDNQLLAEQIADFYLDQLSLPANWSEIIRDQNVIGNIVRKKLTGEYTDQKGEFVERRVESVLNEIQRIHGISHAHGQVRFIGKEVDHAIPSLEEPYVLIMVSYMETTSSSQTTRANEQQAIFQKIVGENIRYPNAQRIFVNIVDGAGWLARRSDLRKMYEGCHYCLNMKTLDQLEGIVLSHIPKRFFSL